MGRFFILYCRDLTPGMVDEARINLVILIAAMHTRLPEWVLAVRKRNLIWS